MNNAKDTTHLKDSVTTTKTFKGWMAATNPATNCTVEADASVIAAAAKAIDDVINAADSATINGAVFNFVESAPESTEPEGSVDTGDSAIIFVAVTILSLAGAVLVAKKREIIEK